MNLLNAGKMELMKNSNQFRDQIIAQRDEGEDTELPKTVEDVDKVNLGNVITAAQHKLFNKMLKQFDSEGNQKMRKINKTQCKALHELLCSQTYQ